MPPSDPVAWDVTLLSQAGVGSQWNDTGRRFGPPSHSTSVPNHFLLSILCCQEEHVHVSEGDKDSRG